MKPSFNEKQTTDLATFFLEASGGVINKLKLMKLLYITDREAFIEFGTPITYDSYVSMKFGPVLSNTLDLMNGSYGIEEGGFGTYWNECILRDNVDQYLLTLKKRWAENLSEADLEIAQRVYERYKNHDQWELSELTHDFSEWQNPGKSRIPIDYEDLLKAGGIDSKRIEEIMTSIKTDAMIEHYARLT